MSLHCQCFDCEESAQSSHYYYQLESENDQQFIEIISKKSGGIVARFPLTGKFLDARFDALLLMAALDRFFERGGWFSGSFRQPTHWPSNEKSHAILQDSSAKPSKEND